MPELKISLTALVDTDHTKITLITSKKDAEQLAVQLQDMIQFRGGLKGLDNPIIKIAVESKVMNWIGSLIARGWVDFIPDSKHWKIILKRGE